jgi:hypothetical protein
MFIGGDNVCDIELFHFLVAVVIEIDILTKKYIFHDPHKFIAFRVIVAAYKFHSSYFMLFIFVVIISIEGIDGTGIALRVSIYFLDIFIY